MKPLLFLLFLLPVLLFGQTDTTAAATVVDTTIYDIVDEIPRLPTPCERYDTTAAAKAQCSEVALLNYVNKLVVYPADARDQNISGMAVISFVVEPSGYVSSARVLRDPGGNIGGAAMRAVATMAGEVRFRPAVREEKFVRYNYVLPIRFRLEEAKPYVVTGRDTIYTKVDQNLRFLENDGKLGDYISEQITYPTSGEDSCRTGQLDVQLLVHPDGRVSVQDIIDYNDLGSDFTFEATTIATNTIGKWEPARYQDRAVTSAYDVSFSFAPTSAACATTIASYNEAVDLINEGQRLATDTLTLQAGLAKMDLAVSRFPRDGRFRIVRGQARMDNNLLPGACEDLSLAKEIALIDWYDSVLPLICRQSANQSERD